MRRVVPLLWVGCGFAPVATDGGVAVAVDAPATSCKLGASGGTPIMTLGGPTGGTMRPDLTCAAGELPIGISVTTTMGTRPEGADERVVTAFNVLCGSVTMVAGGPVVAMAAETTGWTANPCGWGPYVNTPTVSCPDNTMLVGLTANAGVTTLFNTVSLTCALMGLDGTLGPLVPPQPVADSGSYSNHMQVANCPAGQVVLGFKDRGDCGVDGIAPVCAPLQCK